VSSARFHRHKKEKMNEIMLPHAKERVDLDILLVVCDELMLEYRGRQLGVNAAVMPVYASQVTLLQRLAKKPDYVFSFDVACRLVSSQRNTKQASRQFFANPGNAQWFELIPETDGISLKNKVRSRVQGVRFTNKCIEHWNELPESQRASCRLRAQALLNGEVDVQNGGNAVEIPEAEPSAASEPKNVAMRRDMVEALVASIHAAHFIPQYRKKVLPGAVVTGWDKRLENYFWPSPQFGYATTAKSLEKLLEQGAYLAHALEKKKIWDASQEATAVQFAHDVFVWGGVPQQPITVTPTTVLAVFRAALADTHDTKALMNSGWTKVAAFATAHLEDAKGGKPQVIWDSRVATSLISRLQALAPNGDIAHMRTMFPHIGTVPGQGGTRPRPMLPGWPNGYGKWTSQIHGSALVREMRDVLNERTDLYPPMPLPGNTSGKWTTRGVEMVLFMDGY
jgi:hypothetical protein